MPVCPACGSASDERAQVCGQCGAALPTAPFVTSTPATRRMGRTMLGVAPASTTPSNPAQDNADGDTSEVPVGDFQPFAPVPGTLAGLNPEPVSEEAIEPPPRTLSGLADPTREKSPAARTLMGFGAWPNASVPQSLGGQSTESASPDGATASPTTGVVAPTTATSTSDGDVRREAAKAVGHATLIGVSPIANENVQSPAAAKSAFKGTLLGVSPFRDPGAEERAPNATGGTFENTAPTSLGGPVDKPQVPGHATIIGLPTPVPAAGTEPSPARSESAPGPNPVHKGTLLGVAIPGIAPLQPGQAKPEAPKGPLPGTPLISQTVPGQVPPDAKPTRTHVGPSSPPPVATLRTERLGQRKRLAWVFGTAAVLLVAIIVVALGIWWTSVHLAVEVATSDSGEEVLALTCSNCPDGTRAAADAKTTSFRGGHATLELARRLSIGKNQLTLQVVRPGRTRGETVTVTVPVEFRVSSSVASLSADPPVITVELEAAPGTRFVVDGRTSMVGPSGSLKMPVDVSSMLSGQAAAVMPFERSIAYEVIREDASTKGNLVVRTGITPLEITTPGQTHITQNATFTLSGRTSAQAKLTANGHKIGVNADGSFVQEMALSAPGATKLYIRAEEAKLAPRIAEVALERVTNLRQRADELARPLLIDFDSIAALAVTKPDSLVALHAEVVDIASTGSLTRIVGTSSCRQGSCLSSVRASGPISLRKGDRFVAIGKARLTPRPSSSEYDLAIDAALVVEDAERR